MITSIPGLNIYPNLFYYFKMRLLQLWSLCNCLFNSWFLFRNCIFIFTNNYEYSI